MKVKKELSKVGLYYVEDLMAFGLGPGIIMSYLRKINEYNKANGTNLYHNRYWTYNTHKAYVKIFPMCNEQQIKRFLWKLEEDEALLVARFNKNKFNMTNWYAINDDSSKSPFWTPEDDLAIGRKPDPAPDVEEVEP